MNLSITPSPAMPFCKTAFHAKPSNWCINWPIWFWVWCLLVLRNCLLQMKLNFVSHDRSYISGVKVSRTELLSSFRWSEVYSNIHTKLDSSWFTVIMLCFRLMEASSWINIVQSIKDKNAARVWDKIKDQGTWCYMSQNKGIKSNIIAITV